LDGFRDTQIGYHDERRGTIIGDVNDVETEVKRQSTVQTEKV
jgi:hypothetical protein